MTYSKLIASTGLCIALFASSMSLVAQDDQRPNRAATPESAPEVVLPGPSAAVKAYGLATSPRWLRRPEKTSPLSQAVSKLKKAESDDARSEAESEIREALSKEYEEQMNKYDARIESFEKELEEMRERLSRRRKAKEEMVDLKLKAVIAEANGLGWPGDSTGRERSRNEGLFIRGTSVPRIMSTESRTFGFPGDTQAKPTATRESR